MKHLFRKNRTSLIKHVPLVSSGAVRLLVPKFTVIECIGDMFGGGLVPLGLALVANAALQLARRTNKATWTVIVLLSSLGPCGSTDGCYFSLYLFSEIPEQRLATKATLRCKEKSLKICCLRWWITLSMANWWCFSMSGCLWFRHASSSRRFATLARSDFTNRSLDYYIWYPWSCLCISENGVGVLDYGLILVLVGHNDLCLIFVMMGKNPFHWFSVVWKDRLQPLLARQQLIFLLTFSMNLGLNHQIPIQLLFLWDLNY